MILSDFGQLRRGHRRFSPRPILVQKRRPLLVLLLLSTMLGAPAPSWATDPLPAAARSLKVNINAADAQTLAANLKGIGVSRAQEIVRHRETYGPFVSLEELMDVKGIGRATLEQNRDLITLQ